MRKLGTAEFIRRSELVHGSTYDYSSTRYVTARVKVVITCRIHGEFLKLPNDHIHGGGCQKCAQRVAPTTSEFIDKAMLLTAGRFDYSKAQYVNSNTKVCIICPDHGEFWQTPNNHLKGRNCPQCSRISGDRRYTVAEFIEKAVVAHGSVYAYTKVNYVNSLTPVVIICRQHGEFRQAPASHLRGNGCPICAGVKKGTAAEFTDKAKNVHGDLYDYSLVDYVNRRTKVLIGCSVHGLFPQEPGHHLSGAGCPKCIVASKGVWGVAKWEAAATRSTKFIGFMLYIIRCYSDTENFIKVGKTYRAIAARFANARAMPYTYTIIHCVQDTAEGVSALEAELQALLTDYKYTPTIPFGGHTECFKPPEDLLESIVQTAKRRYNE
jgi:hypothetical protein